MNTSTNAAVLAPVTVGDRHADITFTVSASALGLDDNDAYWAGLAVCDAAREVLVDAHEGDVTFAITFVFTARAALVVGTRGNGDDCTDGDDDLLADIARVGLAAIAEYIVADAAEMAA